ncbi:MAG: gluconeogenesis factor YvcK family protein [Chloroflexota bacterium]
MSFFKWMYPGMRVKRWLVLLTFGIVLISLGLAYFSASIYHVEHYPPIAYYLTLQFLNRAIRGALFSVVGIGSIVIAVVQLNRSLVSVFLPSGDRLVDLVYRRRQVGRGPRIVCIGGGHGLSNLLRGMKEYTGNLVAIVTVADDGGSSGRLREELSILPPGDFRQCIVALSDVEPLMTKLFQYRFGSGDGLEGHSFGNLFIAAMIGVTGNFEQAVRESSRVLNVRGQILPSTLSNVTLHAELTDSRVVAGEHHITSAGGRVERVSLLPAHVEAHVEAVAAIQSADLVVIGPGSLYTSVLPNLLVEGIATAVRQTSALRVYVCNVATEAGETDHYDVVGHVEAIERHVGPGMLDVVLVNDRAVATPTGSVERVAMNGVAWLRKQPQLTLVDVVDPDQPTYHHPAKLAKRLIELFYDRTSGRPSAGAV